MPGVRRKVSSVWFAVAGVLFVSSGNAFESCPRGRYSSCLDANALWLRPGDSDFITVAASTPRSVGFRAGASWVERPLSLEVAAPDASGREIPLVERALDEHVLLAFGVGPRLELGLAWVTVLRQSGTGPNGIQSQSGVRLAATAVRDPRFGFGYVALDRDGLDVSLRADVALPFGDPDAYASAGAVTAAPSAVVRVEAGRVALGAELGARLRPSVELGSVRQGSQLYAAIALSVRLFAPLRLSVEAFALPSLVDSTSARARDLGLSVRSLPAEWLASLRWAPLPRFSAALAGGSGLPLSSEKRAGQSDAFLGSTSPEFRGLVDLGYSY